MKVHASTWVLLRGLTRESAHWGDFGARLAAQLGAAHRVVALDLPGNGALHRQASPASIAEMVAVGRNDLAGRDLAPPYVLVAMSLGAMVAVQWCASVPAEIGGAVLINTSLGGVSPFWQRLQPHNYLKLAALLRPGMPALDREARVLALTSSDPHRHAGVAQRWATIAHQRPVARRNLLRQLMAAARFRQPEWRLLPPLLLLASSGDRLVCPQCSERLAAQWDVPLRVHAGAGHDLPLDDPDWVLTRIEEWRNGNFDAAAID